MDAGKTVFGIDLGTTYSCIAYVDETGRPVVVQNAEGQNITPSVVLFESGNRTVVGEEAKNNAALTPDRVVEMVKRHMGEAPPWRFEFEGVEYSPEQISSFILLKVVNDASKMLNRPITDVVITCPAYFGIPQREATKNAGVIAGLNVLEIINEPTAAAIDFGLQDDRDQVVLVYDLGGGTFDVTMIEIKGGSITVIATGGDHNLGGRNWDEEVVKYLAQEWQRQSGSSADPFSSPETVQELWERAERAKQALTAKDETKVPVRYEGQLVSVTLTRDKFNELTAPLLEKTIMYTQGILAAAGARGYRTFDQLLLVGGSTRMLQVEERLKREFPSVAPRMHDPDQAVAKGAAMYGLKLAIGQRIRAELADILHTTEDQVDVSQAPQAAIQQATGGVAAQLGMRREAVEKLDKTTVTNVASHSFGIIAYDMSSGVERKFVSNLVLAQSPLPQTVTKQYGTLEANQSAVTLEIMENTITDQQLGNPELAEKIGEAELSLPAGLPAGAPIEVTFELNREGRLHLVGAHRPSGRTIEATIETDRSLSAAEVAAATAQTRGMKIV